MYRVNFYPESAENRQLVRRGAIRRALVLGLVASALLLAFSLTLSGILLAEQARDLRASIERLSSQIEQASQPRPELTLATETLKLRAERIDWSPAFAAIASHIDASLRLDRVSGSAAWKRTPAAMSIEGRVESGSTPVENVSAFMDALRSDHRIGRIFPSVTLGALKGGSGGEFEVSCRTDEDGR